MQFGSIDPAGDFGFVDERQISERCYRASDVRASVRSLLTEVRGRTKGSSCRRSAQNCRHGVENHREYRGKRGEAQKERRHARRRLDYAPHPLWTAIQQVDEVRSASPLPTAPLLLLLALVEAALAGCTSEDGRRDMLFHLIAQPWGRCAVVPYLIAARYRMKTPGFSLVLRQEAERTGADAWCADSRPSAVDLVSQLV